MVMTPTTLVAHRVPAATRPFIRKLRFADLWQALAQGLDDFNAVPTQLVFLGLLYPMVGFIAARAATGDLLPLLFPLLAGLSLMGPVLAIGTFEISRQREAGLPVSWLTALAVLKSPSLGGIAMIGAVLLLISGSWLFSAHTIYTATMGSIPEDSLRSFAHSVLRTAAGHRLILLGNTAGAAFAMLVLTISAMSLPMLLDRACSPLLAVQTSARTVLRNPVTIPVWGLIVAGLLILGSLPALIGLAVTMPVLGHATWHLYRRTVVFG